METLTLTGSGRYNLMLHIEKSCESTFLEDMFVTSDLTTHDVVRLRQKDDWGTPAAPEMAAPEVEYEGDDEPDYELFGEDPSWLRSSSRR